MTVENLKKIRNRQSPIFLLISEKISADLKQTTTPSRLLFTQDMS